MKIDFIKNRKFLKTLCILPAVFFLTVTSPKSQSNEIVLAQAKDREISVREFLERSDLRIPPNHFNDKNTTPCKLRFEKILALATRQNDHESLTLLLQSKFIGIKDQFMREKFAAAVACNKVELDSKEVKNTYRLPSIRKPESEFYIIQNKELATTIKPKLDLMKGLVDQIFTDGEEILNEKSVCKANYKDPYNNAIHDALFTNIFKAGTRNYPIKLNNGDYIVMRGKDCVDYPLISSIDQKNRLQEVIEILHKKSAKLLTLDDYRKEVISQSILFTTKNLNRNNFAK